MSPIARWVSVGCVVLVLGAAGYAFATRYRRNWDALLRTWSTPQREDGGPDGGPARGGPDGWSRSRAGTLVFVGGFVLVVLGLVPALAFDSAGWLALAVVGALIEGGAAILAGLRS